MDLFIVFWVGVGGLVVLLLLLFFPVVIGMLITEKNIRIRKKYDITCHDAGEEDSWKDFLKIIAIGSGAIIGGIIVIMIVGSIFIKIGKLVGIDKLTFSNLPKETKQMIRNDCHSENNFCATPEATKIEEYWE